MTEEEQDAINELKAAFPEDEISGLDETLFLRFVRGYWTEKTRKETTEETFRKTIAFRKKVKAGELLNTELSKEATYFKIWPHDYHGFDKQGHPVYIEKAGTADPKTLMAEFTLDELTELHVQMQENLDLMKQESQERSGHRTYKSVVIMDLYDFGSKHLSSSFRGHLKAMIDIDQFFYPESLTTLYIINAPFVFRAMWTIVKAFLHPLTKKKIQILGGNYLPKLQEVIDDENIPKYLGGKCTCCTEERLELQMDTKLAAFRARREERLQRSGK